jgi:hypothetical protein
MRKISTIAVGLAMAVGLLSATQTAATADTVCSLHITAPSTVVIGSAYAQLKYTTTSTCNYTDAAVEWFDASGQYHSAPGFPEFTPGAPSVTVLYQASDDNYMGRLHSVLNGYYAPGYNMQLNTVFMTIKYSSLTYFTPARKGSAVFVNILSKQYVPSAAGYGASPNRLVYLQRYINGGWQTMLGHITDGNGANTFGFVQAKAYNYRVITTESDDAWGRTGGAAAK